MTEAIAYSGTHGTGKTTAVYLHAGMLCRQHSDRRVGIVAEVAGATPWDLGRGYFDRPRGEMKRIQSWLFHTQISRELEAARNYDIIIIDRTCCDVIAYTQALNLPGLATAMMPLAALHLARYDKILFRTAGANPYQYNNGYRESDNKQFRQDVENHLLAIYKQLGAMEKLQYVS